MPKFIVLRKDLGNNKKDHLVYFFDEELWQRIKDHPRLTATTITQASTATAAKSQGAYAMSRALNADPGKKQAKIDAALRATDDVNVVINTATLMSDSRGPRAAAKPEPVKISLGEGAGAW